MLRARGIGRRFGLVGLVAAAMAMAGPALAQGGLEELRSRYPGVKVYHPHGRVLTVWGTPMTPGETPREAADEWVFRHSDVFGSALDLEEFREVKLRRAPEGKERRVFMYRQMVDELPVVGSSFRVMTEGEPESGPAVVVYVGGAVATRPAGGLPEPVVTPAQAIAAAKAHERGRALDLWDEPELVAIYDDAPAGDGVAYPAWRLASAGDLGVEHYTFYIHAVGGHVARFHSDIAHADDIQGTVTGNATPTPDSGELGPDTFDLTLLGCPNAPDEFALPHVWMVAELPGTSTVVATDWTDESGDYTLEIPSSTGQVAIFTDLKGPVWFILHASDPQLPNYPWGDPIDRLPYGGNPITGPATGVNLEYNAVPTEMWTAFVNAQRNLSRASVWLDVDENDLPQVPAVVQSVLGSCNAGFTPPTAAFTPWTVTGHLSFKQGQESVCANYAFSTYVAHEFSHYVLYHLAEITTLGAFHEGFADSVALLLFNTEIMGQDRKGCGNHARWPRQEGVTQAYPKCKKLSGPQDCSMGEDFSPHCVGELLSALWMDMRDEFGASATRTLLLDWMMIARLPLDAFCASTSTNVPQSADATTLIDVLMVADDAQKDAICRIFRDRQIVHSECGDSAGWFCYADCDGSGILDFWDFLCFQNAFATGDSYADCDGDGERSFFDFLCFQSTFAAGCI